MAKKAPQFFCLFFPLLHIWVFKYWQIHSAALERCESGNFVPTIQTLDSTGRVLGFTTGYHTVTLPTSSLSRTPLTSGNNFTSTKSRIIQLCLELTSTVQKVSVSVSEAQTSLCSPQWGHCSDRKLSDAVCLKMLVRFVTTGTVSSQALIMIMMINQITSGTCTKSFWWWISFRYQCCQNKRGEERGFIF